MINDNTAVALGWGIWKNKKGQFNSEPKEGQSSDQHVGPCTVMFIDLGELYLLFLFLFHNNIVTS